MSKDKLKKYDKLCCENVSDLHARACAKVLGGVFYAKKGNKEQYVKLPQKMTGPEVRSKLTHLWGGVYLA